MAEAAASITVQLPSELHDRLDAVARAFDRPHSWVVERAIEAFVEVTEIKQAVAEANAGDFASDAEVETMFAKWPTAGASLVQANSMRHTEGNQHITGHKTI